MKTPGGVAWVGGALRGVARMERITFEPKLTLMKIFFYPKKRLFGLGRGPGGVAVSSFEFP